MQQNSSGCFFLNNAFIRCKITAGNKYAIVENTFIKNFSQFLWLITYSLVKSPPIQ